MTARTPLQWPIGRPRATHRRAAQFAVTGPVALRHLEHQVRLIGGKFLVVSTNLPVGKHSGDPLFSGKAPADPGVAAYFTLDGEEVAFCCDRWTHVEDNLRAIGKTVEALRGIARWGTDDMVRASFAGFAALPATTGAGWWEVLGIDRHATSADIELAYRGRLKEVHPDAGGDAEAFHRVQEAYQAARAMVTA